MREAAASVTDLIDGSAVYAGKAPQNTGACVIYQRIGTERDHAMGADTGLTDTRIQVTSWGKHYASAQAIAEAVRGVLQDYSGTAADVVIQRIFLEAEWSRGYDADARLWGHIQYYHVWHRET